MRRLLLSVLVPAVLTGCSTGPNLVGTWHSALGGAFTTYHFRKDGTFNLDLRYQTYHAVVAGKYHVESGKLFMNPSSSNVDGFGPDIEDIRGKIGQPSRVTLKIYGPDSFQIGVDEPPLVLQRMSREP